MEVMRPTRDQWKSIYFISLTNCFFCVSQLYVAFLFIILFTISLYHQVLLLLLLDASNAAGAVIKYWLLFPLSLSFNIFFCCLLDFLFSSPYDSEIGIMYVCERRKIKKKYLIFHACLSIKCCEKWSEIYENFIFISNSLT
jgi:hypothetical protein